MVSGVLQVSHCLLLWLTQTLHCWHRKSMSFETHLTPKYDGRIHMNLPLSRMKFPIVNIFQNAGLLLRLRCVYSNHRLHSYFPPMFNCNILRYHSFTHWMLQMLKDDAMYLVGRWRVIFIWYLIADIILVPKLYANGQLEMSAAPTLNDTVMTSCEEYSPQQILSQVYRKKSMQFLVSNGLTGSRNQPIGIL